MLDKIKSLKQIIEPKANKLGISFEEAVSRLDDNYKLAQFMQQIDKVYYVTTLEGICVSPLFEYSEMINYLSNYFSLDITKDEYIKILKNKVLSVLENPNWRTNETILLINHSDRDIRFRTRSFRQNNIDRFKSGDLNWDHSNEYVRSDKFERSINKIINDLHIDIKSSKYKVLIIDGDKELQDYLSILNLNVDKNTNVYLGNQCSNIGNHCTNNYSFKYVPRHPSISPELLPYSMDEINDKVNFIKNNYSKIKELDQIVLDFHRSDLDDERIVERRTIWNSKIWNHPDKEVKKNHERGTNYLRLVIEIDGLYELINSTSFKEINKFIYFPANYIIERLLSKFNKSGYPKSHYYSNDFQKNHLFKLNRKLNTLNSLM